MNTRTGGEDYLNRLRQELADLPVSEVDEIVQDLEPQLAELADELGPALSPETLAARLGTPAEYAEELRGAMGVTVRGHRRSVWRPRTLLWVVVAVSVAAVGVAYVSDSAAALFTAAVAAGWFAAVRQRPEADELASLPEVTWLTEVSTRTERNRRVVAYLASIRPGMLLVRAGVLWLGVVLQGNLYGWWDAWPVVVATGVAAFSILAGHRVTHDRRWLWWSLPLTGYALGVALRVVDTPPRLLGGYY